MTPRDKKIFITLVVVAIGLGFSTYFAGKRIAERKSEMAPTATSQVVVVDAPTVDHTLPAQPTPEKPLNGGIKGQHGCAVDPLFTQLKFDLGKIVNNRQLRESSKKKFLQQIEEFRGEHGLPLPIMVDPQRLEDQNVVFNRCRPSCRGNVYEVFVFGVEGNFIHVLSKNGGPKKLALEEKSISLASIDELNKTGVPFRSWLAPVSESDWYIMGNSVFYNLDIPGLWLKIDNQSHWRVVTDGQPIQLKKVDEPLKILGCNEDEACLEGSNRHFKAPRACRN